MLCDHCAKQSVGVCVVDGDRQNLSCLPTIALEHHDAIARRAARQLNLLGLGVLVLGTRLAEPFDQDLHVAAEKGLVVFFANLILQYQEPVVTLFLHLFGDIVEIPVRPPSSWPFALLKD